MEEKRTHELVGTVVSDACDKTILKNILHMMKKMKLKKEIKFL